MTSSERPLSGTTLKKEAPAAVLGWGRIIWKPQMPLVIGLGAFQPYSRREFQQTLWERFRGRSGIFPEFLPESASRTGGTLSFLSLVVWFLPRDFLSLPNPQTPWNRQRKNLFKQGILLIIYQGNPHKQGKEGQGMAHKWNCGKPSLRTESVIDRVFGEGVKCRGQTRVDLATLAFFPVFCRIFWARKRRKSH